MELKETIGILIKNKTRASELIKTFPEILFMLRSNPEAVLKADIINEKQLEILEAALTISDIEKEKKRHEHIADSFLAAVYLSDMRYYQEENIVVLCLDELNNIISRTTVSKGAFNKSVANVQQIFKPAILNNAHKIILAHNHPGGKADPSKEDIEFTRTIRDAGKILGIDLIDHIIISADNYYSFLDNKLI